MTRTTDYRGCQIHMELVGQLKDMLDLWFSIQGSTQPASVAAIGKHIKVHGGPFSQCWAHLVGKLAGQVTIDVILSMEEEGPSTDEW